LIGLEIGEPHGDRELLMQVEIEAASLMKANAQFWEQMKLGWGIGPNDAAQDVAGGTELTIASCVLPC
jgi:hypothetical protein